MTRQREQQQSQLCHQSSGASGNLPCLALPMARTSLAQNHPEKSHWYGALHMPDEPLSRLSSWNPLLALCLPAALLKSYIVKWSHFSCSSLCNLKYSSPEHWVSEMYKTSLNSQYCLYVCGVAHQHRICPLIASGQGFPKPFLSLCC